MVADFNKIYVDSAAEILPQNVFNLCFVDGSLLSKKLYSLVDGSIHINNPATDNLVFYQLRECGILYEYHRSLRSDNVLISGDDIWGNTLDNLNQNQTKRFMRGISDGPRGRMKSATFRLRKRSMIKEGGKV